MSLSGSRATEDNVRFFPTVNLPAVRAGKLLPFHFCRRPQFFFNGATGISQLGRGRATHEQTLNSTRRFFRAGPGRVE